MSFEGLQQGFMPTKVTKTSCFLSICSSWCFNGVFITETHHLTGISNPSLHLLVLRGKVLPPGWETCSISCFSEGERGRRGGKVGNREALSVRRKLTQSRRKRGRVAGLLHLALITQTERFRRGEETERLSFLAHLGIQWLTYIFLQHPLNCFLVPGSFIFNVLASTRFSFSHLPAFICSTTMVC